MLKKRVKVKEGHSYEQAKPDSIRGGEMKSNKTGLIVYWVGATYLLVWGWLVNWWIVPMYKYTPVEKITQTVWAPGSPLFIIWAFGIPVGAILAVIGMLLRTEPTKIWQFLIVTAFIILSVMFPATMGYHIVVFGALGGLIAAFFLAVVWYWGKKRTTLEGPAKTAADLQLIGYVFFLAAAWLLCGVLGNPFHTNPGLYFPEKVLQARSLPQMYSQGIKVIMYLALGWLFLFLSHYKAYKAK